MHIPKHPHMVEQCLSAMNTVHWFHYSHLSLQPVATAKHRVHIQELLNPLFLRSSELHCRIVPNPKESQRNEKPLLSFAATNQHQHLNQQAGEKMNLTMYQSLLPPPPTSGRDMDNVQLVCQTHEDKNQSWLHCHRSKLCGQATLI